ncbi:MAG: carboxylating nicotinate-nucleotide diphosphorylase [Candidatus Eremiobacteraeota bacterium]|nr:carboxylating nicotinate-nucleotide diphosphorylase [Candidatus Eremiobacteraeota bacterium]
MGARQAALSTLPIPLYEGIVLQALREDLGDAGDITSDAVVDADARMRGALVARAPGILVGVDLAVCAFRTVDPETEFQDVVADGTMLDANTRIAVFEGSARHMLAAERTALNFLCHLSGVATLTAAYVRAVAGYAAAIVDTRKTLPGLRALQKYAVRAGGGRNHRFGLYDAVLIKDNHIAVAGGVERAIVAAKGRAGHLVKIEIEVDSLAQLDEALQAGADAVLLDNLTPEELRTAVRMNAGRALLEASGSVSLEDVREIAATGVDVISIGRLTHSAAALDIGLDAM